VRRLFIVAMIAMIGVLPAAFASSAFAQTGQAEPTVVTAADQQHRLLVAGAGAILGILFFNLVTSPFGAVPWAQAAIIPAPKDIAVGSRLFAALSGGGGAILAHYLYNMSE